MASAFEQYLSYHVSLKINTNVTSDFRVFVTDPPVRHTPDKCVVFNRTALLLLFFLGVFFCSAEELQARLFESFKKKKKEKKKVPYLQRRPRSVLSPSLCFVLCSVCTVKVVFLYTVLFIFPLTASLQNSHRVVPPKTNCCLPSVDSGKKKKVMMEIIIKKEKKLFVV